MTTLVYHFFRILSLLPLGVLYVLSDFEYLLVYRLIGYRRKIVRRNLTTSFPEKSAAELRKIERAFYRWFCDYFFEAVKLLTISDAELRRRFQVYGSEEVEARFQPAARAVPARALTKPPCTA